MEDDSNRAGRVIARHRHWLQTGIAESEHAAIQGDHQVSGNPTIVHVNFTISKHYGVYAEVFTERAEQLLFRDTS
jgi:hypothetical protein